MLSSLRSAATRSLSRHTRSFHSPEPDVVNPNLAFFPRLNNSGSPTTPSIAQTRPPRPLKVEDVPPARDPLLDLFTSCMMSCGKRARAARATSEILLHINALTRAAPLPILRAAVERAAPAVRVMNHKAGGKMVVKPVALNERQRMKKAIDWILEASMSRPQHTKAERIARECISIVKGDECNVLEWKKALHKTAMVNRGNIPRVS